MTNWGKVGVLMCVLALPCLRGFAQITITADDVGSRLVFGTMITEHTDLLASSINVGSPGSTSWDFSALGSGITRVLTSVDPATTPYGSQFPNPTHALRTTMSTTIGQFPITAAQYQYLKLGTTLSDQGTMLGGVIIPGVLSGLLGTLLAPSSITCVFPCTFGTTWTSTYYAATAASLNDSLIAGVVFSHNVSSVVDGYGPMTLPDGSVQQALRVRKTDVVTPTLPAGSPFTVLSFQFFARNGAMVNLIALDTTQEGNVIRVSGPATWRSQVITDVPLTDNHPAEFALMQNYPNPFNPSTSIGYVLAHRGFVTLTVFNTLGQQVAQLVNAPQEAGLYKAVWNADGLASGVYFYRLSVARLALQDRPPTGRDGQPENFSSMRKMILLR